MQMPPRACARSVGVALALSVACWRATMYKPTPGHRLHQRGRGSLHAPFNTKKHLMSRSLGGLRTVASSGQDKIELVTRELGWGNSTRIGESRPSVKTMTAASRSVTAMVTYTYEIQRIHPARCCSLLAESGRSSWGASQTANSAWTESVPSSLRKSRPNE